MQEQELKKKFFPGLKRPKKTVITGMSDPGVAGIDNLADLQVLEVLSERGAMTRGGLVTITGMPRSTLYDSLARLQLAGLVSKFAKKARTGPGRPLVMFESIFNTMDG